MRNNILDKHNARRLIDNKCTRLNRKNYVDLCCPLLSEEEKQTKYKDQWEAIHDIVEKHYQHMTNIKRNFSRKEKERMNKRKMKILLCVNINLYHIII